MHYRTLAILLVAAFATAGCSKAFYGGAAVGAGTAAVAYEVYNEEQLDDLEEAYEEGEISEAEYERRKDEIEDRSVVN